MTLKYQNKCKGSDAMIKYIFFDLGDTIIDTSISHKALYSGLQSILPNKLVTDDLVLKWEKHSYHIFNYYKKRKFYSIKRLQIMSLKNVLLGYGIDLKDDKLVDIVNELWRYFIENCQLYEDAVPVLSRLVQDGYELGLITDGDEENVTSTLKQHNLTNVFKTKIISSVVKSYKPDLLLFERALELAKCLPQEAIYVGDSVADIYGAKQLGLITVIIHRNGMEDAATEVEPDFIIYNLSQLSPVIKNISGGR